jgi:KUP system potassium uptake protein
VPRRCTRRCTPTWGTLATLATVIASQATISGAFSVTQQASRLNHLPRLAVLYTSDVSRGD